MSMSDCRECWNTPRLCGYKYRSWTRVKLSRFVEMLSGVLMEKSITNKEEPVEGQYEVVPNPERVSAVEARPGDVIVVEIPTVLPRGALDQYKRLLVKTFPGNAVVVLDGGARLIVVRPDPL